MMNLVNNDDECLIDYERFAEGDDESADWYYVRQRDRSDSDYKNYLMNKNLFTNLLETY